MINKSLIHAVATLIKANWEELALNLGQNTDDLLEYKEKSQKNFVRAVAVIEDWEKFSQEAKVAALLQACEKCGISKNTIEKAYKKELKQPQ